MLGFFFDQYRLHKLITLAWLGLVLATLMGWWFGGITKAHIDVSRLATTGVLVTAFLKAWLIGRYFMELKHAKWPLKRIYDAWIVIVCTTLMVICLNSPS